jgi:hypothetical protein
VKITLVFVLLILSACVGEIQGSRNETGWRTLRVTIEDHQDLDKNAIIAGANEWNIVSVQAILVPPSEAAISVKHNDEECVAGRAKNPPAAHAYPTNVIDFYVNGCNGRTADGKIDPAWLSKVMTHEFGHLLGVWDHIPIECDDPDEGYKYLKGQKICGPAILNRFPNAPSLNAMDIAAYKYAQGER